MQIRKLVVPNHFKKNAFPFLLVKCVYNKLYIFQFQFFLYKLTQPSVQEVNTDPAQANRDINWALIPNRIRHKLCRMVKTAKAVLSVFICLYCTVGLQVVLPTGPVWTIYLYHQSWADANGFTFSRLLASDAKAFCRCNGRRRNSE